jgi:hypothetical protein
MSADLSMASFESALASIMAMSRDRGEVIAFRPTRLHISHSMFRQLNLRPPVSRAGGARGRRAALMQRRRLVPLLNQV